MKKIVFYVFFVFTMLVSLMSCSTGEEDKSGRELEMEIQKLLDEIVVELKTPKPIKLTPRTFIELNAIMVVSNYFWTKEIINSKTNITAELLDEYRTRKKKDLLSNYNISIEEFENYSVNNYQQLQKFSQENPDVVEKYNELSRSLPTLFEDY
ncbi:MAG: hypothetical protein N2712_00650 [Brevinematales bacterium]|nr:hypothetical protein [Brevinematales bacterium]